MEEMKFKMGHDLLVTRSTQLYIYEETRNHKADVVFEVSALNFFFRTRYTIFSSVIRRFETDILLLYVAQYSLLFKANKQRCRMCTLVYSRNSLDRYKNIAWINIDKNA